MNQKVALRTLEKLGYRADVVPNGKEALQAVQEGGHDLVLMDCQMPIMDGFAATREIRKYEDGNGGSMIPIIAMTASAMKGDREKCLAVGMNDYITKPIRVEELIAAIERHLPVSVKG